MLEDEEADVLQMEEDHGLGLIADERAEAGAHDYVPAVLEMLLNLLLDIVRHVLEILEVQLIMQLCSGRK